MTARYAAKQIPPEPHWDFCYTMLHKVSGSFALVIQQLGTDLRNADRSLLNLFLDVSVNLQLHKFIAWCIIVVLYVRRRYSNVDA
ncbi:hypothetical protein LWI28_024119 [Acer negundo]|uniref:Uncharacterized protein n=1 Tax=Acer negundo TaxID=4023 RepID=A0AAD5J2B8_ACENE|nr:hypothetical protein LWI28_024119 [Acer negundo]